MTAVSLQNNIFSTVNPDTKCSIFRDDVPLENWTHGEVIIYAANNIFPANAYIRSSKLDSIYTPLSQALADDYVNNIETDTPNGLTINYSSKSLSLSSSSTIKSHGNSNPAFGEKETLEDFLDYLNQSYSAPTNTPLNNSVPVVYTKDRSITIGAF